MKEFHLDELSLSMHKELIKQASDEQPNLVKAAECLHTALEILEEQGLQARADQVLQLLDKIAQGASLVKEAKIHSLQQLMEAGVTQHDLKEFARGSPKATAKLNLVLRKLGLSEHEIAKFLGPGKVMSEEAARKAISPNEPGSLMEFKSLAPSTPVGEGEQAFEFKSLALKKKPKNPGRPDKIKDPATKGLTPAKEVKNLLEHGHPLNITMADDAFAIDGIDELMNMDIYDDTLEVSEKDMTIEDFEDERD
jgi:hypothetical protein